MSKNGNKASLVRRTNKAIDMLNEKVGSSLFTYEESDRTIREFEYVFLNASQAYAKGVKINQAQLNTPFYVNDNH
jgi:hypothetical protein